MSKLLKAEKGLTLVEVLASTVLITLILVSFLTILAQGAKTNIVSENILDSTYIAQTEMEKIYGLSKSISPSNKSAAFPIAQYESPIQKTIEGTKWKEYKKKNGPSEAVIIIRLENTTEKMTRIIVEVYEESKKNPSAKMENVLIWEGAS